MTKEELYSPPFLEQGVAPDEDGLRALLVENPNNTAALFTLANLKIRQAQYAGAVDLLRRLLDIEPGNARAHSNLGTAYMRAGNLEDAASRFTQASLIDRTLAVPQLQLGRICLLKEELVSAAAYFERTLKLDPEQTDALIQLGSIKLSQGEPQAGLEHLEKAFSIDPRAPGLEGKLGELYFRRGREVLLTGDLPAALRIWASGYRVYPRGFIGSPEAVRSMRKIVQSFNDQEPVRRLVGELRRRIKNGDETGEFYYPAFLEIFFALGLMPEAYENRETLDAQAEKWKERSLEEGDYPYAHFRLAILYCYLGRPDEALARVLHCQDRFPKKKQKGLRLPELAAVLKQTLSALERPGDDPALLEDKLWREAGFDNPFELRLWRAAGAPPAEAASWKSAGFGARQMRSWRRHGLKAEQAALWKAAGFTQPKTARQLSKGGFEPKEAAQWLKDSSLSPERAVQFKKAGFDDPKAAGEWASVFLFPWEAATWFELGFHPQEAGGWLHSGIKDPYLALAEKRKEEEQS